MVEACLGFCCPGYTFFLDSERSDECIDFTMIITRRNNAPISNSGGGFRCNSEYPWCIIEVKNKHFSTVFKKIEKNKKKMTEKRELLCKTIFKNVPYEFSNFYEIAVENAKICNISRRYFPIEILENLIQSFSYIILIFTIIINDLKFFLKIRPFVEFQLNLLPPKSAAKLLPLFYSYSGIAIIHDVYQHKPSRHETPSKFRTIILGIAKKKPSPETVAVLIN
ncbi:Uncharacterized protein FWK35_00005333 [Aphis craccivora]|uniref:Uncharacterized protein n=1 Tax=Aphis craccivora TaxID=307492 RepID=A0A6G0Z6M2_APHCR|nr:Uncharacterized protein FWK35_00005333 [Aphis craccivora]